MQNVIFVILRRMRAPLAALISAYAISVLGFVLIPGMDDQGNPWRMDFFHAFYFVSFMGSTIGFGEIPHPFTDAQRLWTLFSIYATVVVWLYAIGTMISLIQTASFREAVTRNLVTRRIRRLRERFFLICGYGEAGRMLVHALVAKGMRVVVIEKDPGRIDDLELEGLPMAVPALRGDASDPETLDAANLGSERCGGVIALIRNDDANLKIAIASKLLHPGVRVFCRSEEHDTAANMASFGTDHIINPFDTFADDFATALSAPSLYLLRQWLTSPPDTPLTDPVFPPHGLWILCGYGRFGKALYKRLTEHGEKVQVVEADQELTSPPAGTVVGRGTEADTLLEAGVVQAAGIIAGTDNDVNNLSILMTARMLQPQIFTLARQESSADSRIFEALQADLVTLHSEIISSRVLELLTTPLTSEFLDLAGQQDEKWARELIVRLVGLLEENMPNTWIVNINRLRTVAVWEALQREERVLIAHLLRDPDDYRKNLPCLPLLLHRGTERILLPEEGMEIRLGDRILFGGREVARRRMELTCSSADRLHYAMTGVDRPVGYLWSWIARKRGEPAANRPAAG